ncbi:MAG: SMC family ATPase, partial [Gammaproteobacteria bacterium]|nr:SMC family ATPase [Gammaproteobacteria bacterium]
MRPLRLEMAAFGPFADTEIIDFSNLGENPLFLINGPTGAGKTTILDAICYALYGQTTGNEREGKQMRCSDAESDLLTSVDFVFALGNRTFRILRSPDQKRPKSRGDGFTEQKATANLYEVKPDKDHLIEGPKVTLVNNKISELTGLSADQFRQVMVLPQGKFRELLIASSDSREAIFEQLFQTHVYSALQSKLKLEANQLKSQIRELESNQRGLLTAQDLENAEALTQAIANLNREQVNLNKQKAIADREYADAQTLLQAAHTLDQAFQALIEAQKRKREILAQQPQVDQSRERCRLADQARDIHATFAQLSAQKTEYKTAQQRLEQQQKHLTRVQEDYDSLNKEHELLPQKEKSLSELVQQITDLTGFRTKALLLTDAESKANQTNNKLKQAQVTLDSLTTDRNTAQTQLEQLQVEIEQLRQAQVQLPEKRALLTTIKNEGTIIRQITELKNSLVEAKQDIEQLQKEEKVSHQTLENRKNEKQQLEKIWRTGQAAKLAAGLTNNLPCPVCGSADHPSPAVSNDAIPTDEQLE